jgi:MATE family multidrug resistance protein
VKSISLSNIVTELRKSMRLSLPLVAAQLIYALNGFIATIMIAHMGRDALAASALVWSTFVALVLFFIGILNAVGILVAQSYGAENHEGIEHATAQGFILALLFAIPMMLAMWIAPVILYWTGQSPSVIQLAIPYFHSLGWCMLPLNLLIVMEQFLIGIARTRLVLFMSLIEVPLEIFFFYILLFGKLGMPKLGLPGIGYGITMAIGILVIAIGLFLHFSSNTKKYALFTSCWKINKKYLLELIRVGTPLGGMYCVEVALFATVAFMMGRLGEDVLAAHNIAYQCFVFTLTMIFGISQGATIRVGHEVGRNNKEALKLAAYVNMGIGFSLMLISALLYIGFPQYIIAIDINIHAEKYHMLVHYAATFLFVAGILQLTDCFRLISVGVLRGLKDTKVPMYISMVAFWLIAFPSAYLLGFVCHLGGVGIWWGLVIGLATAAGILLIRFNRLVNKVDLAALLTK